MGLGAMLGLGNTVGFERGTPNEDATPEQIRKRLEQNEEAMKRRQGLTKFSFPEYGNGPEFTTWARSQKSANEKYKKFLKRQGWTNTKK